MDSGPYAFSRAFKELVAQEASLSGGLTLQSTHVAGDGTKKLVFSLNADDGTAIGSVETVLIPMMNKSTGNVRYTACVSSQVGCAMNCQFCFTGRMGLLGNLTAGQIVEQVVEARRYLARTQAPHPIHNIVFMGMGEPFNNYEAVMSAVEILRHPEGLQFSGSKILVSTVGLIPEMRRFRASNRAKLAVSIHATTDEVRDWLVPINRRYPLGALMGTLEEMYPIQPHDPNGPPLKSDDFVVFEYVMLKGVNDSLEDAHRLLAWTKNIYCMINLIVFNPHEGTPFQKCPEDVVAQFRSVLVRGGKICTVRASKGDDEMAACGQLGNIQLAPRPVPVVYPGTHG